MGTPHLHVARRGTDCLRRTQTHERHFQQKGQHASMYSGMWWVKRNLRYQDTSARMAGSYDYYYGTKE